MKPVNFLDEHGNPHWRMVPDETNEPSEEYPTQSRYAEIHAPEKLTQEEIKHIPNLPDHHVSAVAFLMAEAREIAKGKEASKEPRHVFGTEEGRLAHRFDEAIRFATEESWKTGMVDALPEIVRSAALLYAYLKDQEKQPVTNVTSYAKVAQSAPVIPMNQGPSLKDIEDLKRSIEEPLKRAAKLFADKIGPNQANGGTE